MDHVIRNLNISFVTYWYYKLIDVSNMYEEKILEAIFIIKDKFN